MEFLPVWPLPVNTLFFFGFLLFCGSLGGYVAHRWPWLPSITGFMVVGLFAGPNVLGLISPEALAQSRIVVDVALALILYRLGLSLDVKRFINDRSLVVISVAESALTFVAVYFCLVWIGISGLPAADFDHRDFFLACGSDPRRPRAGCIRAGDESVHVAGRLE